MLTLLTLTNGGKAKFRLLAVTLLVDFISVLLTLKN